MAGKSSKMRKTTKKYGGLDSDDVKRKITNAAKRIVKPVRMTAHGLKMMAKAPGYATGLCEDDDGICVNQFTDQEKMNEIMNSGLKGGKSKKLRKTRRKSNKKRSTKRSRK